MMPVNVNLGGIEHASFHIDGHPRAAHATRTVTNRASSAVKEPLRPRQEGGWPDGPAERSMAAPSRAACRVR
jgi:hypothetical protein